MTNAGRPTGTGHSRGEIVLHRPATVLCCDAVETSTTNHDLALPAWGPYTNAYAGISHVADAQRGIRFDLAVIPGFYRRGVLVPNVMFESGFHPWEAAPDLTYYRIRYELEWKDRVFCDASFFGNDDSARFVRCELVNRTSAPQNLVLHLAASLHFPPPRPGCHREPESIRMMKPVLPEGSVWVPATDYTALEYAKPWCKSNLMPDGLLRGETQGQGFSGFSGIGAGQGRAFGADAGDRIAWTFRAPPCAGDLALVLRYRVKDGTQAEFDASGAANGRILLPGGPDFRTAKIPCAAAAGGPCRLGLVSAGKASADLDGFAVVPAAHADAVRFEPVTWHPRPAIHVGPVPGSLLLQYEDLKFCYGLAWDFRPFEVREILADELDRFLRFRTHDHVSKILRGPGEGHFTNVFLRPIVVEPKTTLTVNAHVCAGTREDVERALARFAEDKQAAESAFDAARGKTVNLAPSPSGARLRFSQERMAATTLTNVVYPVYCRRSWIRHYTPGRIWDSLYTWDSGFTGLGLAELDVGRALDCLKAYLTEPGDPHAAFIHHGSPVPVQFYLFLELWNRTQSAGMLRFAYPRLRQYWRFLAGLQGSSTTRTLKSGLLKTWDYFYNSGGWDDYPPQKHVHEKGLTGSVTPVITTAQVIRTAKILRLAALALEDTAGVAEYERESAVLARALQTHAWDPQSGYFGYVEHDADGRPAGVLRHETGANYNMGLDGLSPVMAGICDEPQGILALERLFDPKRCWTPVGLSTVDRSAPYFRTDGYWNGAVWFPHQWFFWKTMLDLGRGDLAWRIASTALDVWRKEVEESYHCFEHFMIRSGRGAGWHQFSGLSCPVLAWYGAYFRPGRLTCGLDAWVREQTWAEDGSALEASVAFHGRPDHESVVLCAMNPAHRYAAAWDNAPARFEERLSGVLEIRVPAEAAGQLMVCRTGNRL